ncbi:hypothetical protein CYMTET_28108 [Cymbomonas tetramitiformis]|uniref:Nucleotide-diphospho-sugar transferase domain-containing protein n=1 Tax=Cymbomonas tetramitiformis TaxID=36881 RepID=A0AAE0FP34_9CHLO|nr:hypothetical protein CYMTET_28108 [Cymbomonas tetramitiformis]
MRGCSFAYALLNLTNVKCNVLICFLTLLICQAHFMPLVSAGRPRPRHAESHTTSNGNSVAAPGSNVAPNAKAPGTMGGAIFMGEEIKTVAQLEAACRRYETQGDPGAAVGHGELILTVVDLAHEEYTYASTSNMMYHLSNVGRVQNLLLIGADNRTCTELRERYIPCFEDGLTGSWMLDETPPLGRAGVIKWFFLNRILAMKKYSVLYMDTDVVTLHDPFFEWGNPTSIPYDLQALSDYPDFTRNWTQWNRPCPLYDPGGADPLDMPVKMCASTGFMFMRPSEANNVFTSAMIQAITNQPDWWEGKIAQRVMLSYSFSEGYMPGLAVRLLDGSEYANTKAMRVQQQSSAGGIDQAHQARMVVLKASGVNVKEKDLELKEMGKWHPEEWAQNLMKTYKVVESNKLTEAVLEVMVNETKFGKVATAPVSTAPLLSDGSVQVPVQPAEPVLEVDDTPSVG